MLPGWNTVPRIETANTPSSRFHNSHTLSNGAMTGEVNSRFQFAGGCGGIGGSAVFHDGAELKQVEGFLQVESGCERHAGLHAATERRG